MGAVVLSLATAKKVVVAIAFWPAGGVGLGEAAGFAAFIFGVGFTCGIVVWAGRGLHARLGIFGDALVGMAVMIEFFLACMLVFAPAMLRDEFLTGGVPMLMVAVVVGLVSGAWIGRDVRQDAAAARRVAGGQEPPDGSEGDRPGS